MNLRASACEAQSIAENRLGGILNEFTTYIWSRMQLPTPPNNQNWISVETFDFFFSTSFRAVRPSIRAFMNINFLESLRNTYLCNSLACTPSHFYFVSQRTYRTFDICELGFAQFACVVCSSAGHAGQFTCASMIAIVVVVGRLSTA